MRIPFDLTGLVDVLLNTTGCHYRNGDIRCRNFEAIQKASIRIAMPRDSWFDVDCVSGKNKKKERGRERKLPKNSGGT